MTPRQLEILQHALGLDQHGRNPHQTEWDKREYTRNHFCAAGADEDTCRELVALGYMKEHLTTDVFPYYNCSVTDEGKAAIRRESPAPPVLTRSQRRYRDYMRVADLYEGFGDWLRAQKERAA